MPRFGNQERKYLDEVLASGNLFYAGGEKTKNLCAKFGKMIGVKYCATASSGTAAIHAAIGALELPPGSEVITTPITDMGTVIGPLYQNLIPVFADVDPFTYNITADTIARALTDRTRAIIVVHLAGNPAEMDEILALARERNLFVIEDCAQSYGAKYKNKPVGTMGNIGCFSLNQYKHITCGDGGLAVTRDEDLYEKICKFTDKYYDRTHAGRRPTALAPNYRMTELQAAVALAQLQQLENITNRRNAIGNQINRAIAPLQGITPHKVYPHNFCSYWFTMFRVNPAVLGCSRDEFATALKHEKVPASGGYIDYPLYMEPVFAKKAFFPGGVWPAEVIAGHPVRYEAGACPVAEEVLKTAIRVSVSEDFSDKQVQACIEGVERAYAGVRE